MVRARSCCNPLEKKNHKCIRNNLVLITAKRDDKFKDLVGLHICNSCEREIYRGRKVLNKSPKNLVTPNPEPLPVNSIDSDENESDKVDSIKNDPPFICSSVDNALKTNKLNKLLSELGEQPIERKASAQFTVGDWKDVSGRVNKLLNIKNNSVNSSESETHQFIKNTKVALAAQTTRAEKIRVLTTLPNDWPMKKIRREFGVSRRMVTCAKKLTTKSGFAVDPPKRKGKKLSDSTRRKVRKFYLSDDVSRVMPGRKDCVSSYDENGEKIVTSKRLLLNSVKNLREEFVEKYPGEKIGRTIFRQLKPPECISAGKKGTHNVCVCKCHQNMKLKLCGAEQALKKRGAVFTESYQNFIQNSVCPKPKSSCYLSTCKKCPGINRAVENLKELLCEHKIEEITYSQWTSTDRY